jgi:hypothetical protein
VLDADREAEEIGRNRAVGTFDGGTVFDQAFDAAE